jgi:hypothetical protein
VSEKKKKQQQQQQQQQQRCIRAEEKSQTPHGEKRAARTSAPALFVKEIY